MTMLIRHPQLTDTPSRDHGVDGEAELAERLAKFHRRHKGETLLTWLGMIPFIVVVAWAVIVGASSLFVR